ncbi:MAG: 3-deoxy-manno-octulosonate cytidylyltransferase [Colwelliaceae bacterium]|nr:3-deoxy-manno-octulosonate cytidylyltransferase [Colwelliaceae bacterium]
MKTVVVIPARYKSSRYPGKPLVLLLEKPMVLWVAELSAKAVGADNVYVATDDERIAKVVKAAGFQVTMTSDQALTGTDRLAEVAGIVDADIYINVQGDEPLVSPQDILNAIEQKKAYPDLVINGYCALSAEEDPSSINIPKVIFTEQHQMIYMSRQAIPGIKDEKYAPVEYYKQVCIYAFNRQELLDYGKFGRKSTIEQSEDIEILRFLEWNQGIRMFKTQPGSLAVDVPEDVAKVEVALKIAQKSR